MNRIVLTSLSAVLLLLFVQPSHAQDSSNNYLQMWDSSSPDNLVNSVCYQSSGNIGISDTTPSYKLDVAGDFRAIGVRTNSGTSDPNFIGGDSTNAISDTLDGCFIGGGYSNSVWDDYSVIAGGYDNTIIELYATIGGGYSNYIDYDAQYSTICGGYNNETEGAYSAVAGGHTNMASGTASFASGAYSTASGTYSTAMGYGSDATGVDSFAVGYSNEANGNYSVCLGYNAEARYDYSFAFGGDSDGGCVAYTEEFVACADGGATFDLDGDQLYVDGTVRADDFIEYSPYPESLETAYASVFSMQRLPDGQYDVNNTRSQLDHENLHPFIRRDMDSNPDPDDEVSLTGCSISAVVGSHNEVIKDLATRIEYLEHRLQELEASCSR